MNLKFRNLTNVDFLKLKHGVGTDDLRPVMQHVCIDVKHECMIVTNAHILVSYPIQILEKSDDCPENVVVHPKIFDSRCWITQHKPKDILHDITYQLTGGGGNLLNVILGEDQVIYFHPVEQEMKYPAAHKVLSDSLSYDGKDASAGIDLIVMKKLIECLPTEHRKVNFKLKGQTKAMCFYSLHQIPIEKSLDTRQITGLIMPYYTNE